MEQKKSKAGLIAFLLILFLIGGTVLGVYISSGKVEIFDKFNNGTKNEVKNEDKNKVEEKMSAEERYKIYAEGRKAELAKFVEQCVDAERNEQSYVPTIAGKIDAADVVEFPIDDITLNYNGDVTIRLKDSTTEDKIFEKAIKCGITEVGNGGISYIIWAISQDGELYLNSQNTSIKKDMLDFTMKKVEGLKYIVDVERKAMTNGSTIVCMDIDGKIYESFETYSID